MMQTVAMTKITADVEQILGAVAAKIDSAAFTSWIRPLQFEICDDVLVLTAQNQFSADYVGAVYSNILSEVAQSFGLNVKIAVRGATVVAPIANDNNVQSYVPAPAQTTCATKSDAFDAFVCCEENDFVLSACKKIAAGSVIYLRSGGLWKIFVG